MMSSLSAVRGRFWLQAGFSLAALVSTVVTLVSREWIEFFTGWDPDGGNGTLEWAIVAVLGVVAISFGFAARREWRRPRAAAAQS
jgi:hypothetical protein